MIHRFSALVVALALFQPPLGERAAHCAGDDVTAAAAASHDAMPGTRSDHSAEAAAQHCEMCSPAPANNDSCDHGRADTCAAMTSCVTTQVAETQVVALAKSAEPLSVTTTFAQLPLSFTLSPATPPPRS